MEVGARKIVLGGGPDVPADREAAKERLSEVLLRLGAEIPPQVTLTLEPTDREIDKRFLFGPVEETVAFVHQLQAAGLTNLGVLLDMGHVPLMGETLESAVTHAGDTLRHIHLGNCILKIPAIRYMAINTLPGAPLNRNMAKKMRCGLFTYCKQPAISRERIAPSLLKCGQ